MLNEVDEAKTYLHVYIKSVTLAQASCIVPILCFEFNIKIIYVRLKC